jgi:predicted nucleotide-binding protein
MEEVMYNLLIHSDSEFWEKGKCLFDPSRVFENTDQEIKKKHQFLTENDLDELIKYPTLFAYESQHELPARLGWISDAKSRQNGLRLKFHFESDIPPIHYEQLLSLLEDLDISKLELHRTHWAIKNVALIDELIDAGHAPKKLQEIMQLRAIISNAIDSSEDSNKGANPENVNQPKKVFVVHGHNEAAKNEVAYFLSKLGLEPIILHDRPNKGRTIIAKFSEESSDAEFAIVLLTADDLGNTKKTADTELNPRARQNVVLELGYFLAKLGPHKVCSLYEQGVEIPSDYDGVLWIPFGPDSDWKRALVKELGAADIALDKDKLIGAL